MNPVTILEFVNVFFAGLLAGIEFVLHFGLTAPTEVLDNRSQLQLRQGLLLCVCACWCPPSSLSYS